MRIETRSAGSDDISALASLVELASAEMIDQRGGVVWGQLEARTAPFEPRLATEVADHSRCVAVGTIDETIVGYAAAEPRVLHDGALMCRLTDLFVLPGARGVGVGEELMEFMINWGREAGCSSIDSLVLPGNRATKNFFEMYGMVARSISVNRTIDPPKSDPASR